MIVIVGGQVITAARTWVVFVGTTLTPGATMKTFGGTLSNFNTPGQMVVSAQTIYLAGNIAGWGKLGDQPASDLSGEVITTITG